MDGASRPDDADADAKANAKRAGGDVASEHAPRTLHVVLLVVTVALGLISRRIPGRRITSPKTLATSSTPR
jgi:hypothetical protein